MTEIYTAMNLDPPGGSAIAGFVVLLFVLGIATVWVYADARRAGMRGALVVAHGVLRPSGFLCLLSLKSGLNPVSL